MDLHRQAAVAGLGLGMKMIIRSPRFAFGRGILLIGLVLGLGAVLPASGAAFVWPAPAREARPWTYWWWMGSAVDPTNLAEVKMATWLFGNVCAGLQLPSSAQNQNAWTVAQGGTYTPTGAPGSWGGHCVPIMGVSPITMSCITWGARLKMSHNFFHDYCDEAYVVLSPDWIEKSGLAKSGFDLATLKADLLTL